MIGVVLWSDPKDRKAVFWCEDQGDLAFYEAAGAALDVEAFFSAGDMVQFTDVNCRKMRKAQNPQLLVGQACRNLPDQLRGSSVAEQQPAEQSARILPFVAQKSRVSVGGPRSKLKA